MKDIKCTASFTNLVLRSNIKLSKIRKYTYNLYEKDGSEETVDTTSWANDDKLPNYTTEHIVFKQKTNISPKLTFPR